MVVPPEGNGSGMGKNKGGSGVKGSEKPSAFEIKTCTLVFVKKSFS